MLRRIWILIILGASVYSVAFIVMEAIPSRSFFHAVKSGDVERVKELLSEKPLLVHSVTGFESDTGLQLAARAGNDEMVAVLLKAGADVNAQTDLGLGPLHEVAFNGNVLVAETLLNAGADVNALGGKFKGTPLYIAAGRGHEALVKLFLEHGALANISSGSGETPLQLATKNHQSNVVAILSNLSLPKQSQP